MIIDGEKWACEACVRGHRVSNCQHSDRPLQHINKKGRPVSQCQHCRSMRKSRASHVKCDCGEKTHKCQHLQSTVDGHKDSCCCNHGGRCTCSHKKDVPALDTVPESDSDGETQSQARAAVAKTNIRRRRANTTHSEGALSLDENGHHRPCYNPSRAQKSGPYQLNRVNTMHGTGSMSNRSADSLLNGDARVTSVDNVLAQEQRKVKSEAASPNIRGAPLGGISQLPPLDLSGLEYPTYANNSFDVFGGVSAEHDQGLFSAGLSATSVDWSHYDLDFNTAKTGDNFAPSNYSQPQSFGAFDFNGSEQAPTMTTGTSGDVSEVEDFMGPSLDDFDPSAAFGRTSTASSGFDLTAAQSSYLANTDLGGMDYDEVGFMKTANSKFLATSAPLAGEEASIPSLTGSGYSFVDDDPSLWIGDYSGLPNITESPDPNMAVFWGTQ